VTTSDPFEQFKAMQRQGWAHFAPLEAITTAQAAQLVKFAGVRAGQTVLDVACGTGVVAITAARAGATVTALDLTPELLARARENARIAGVEIAFHDGDAEALPFADASFDVVVSQFGHMFAPRPDVTVAQLLRVLKPGGTIAFSTWPPETLVGRAFAFRDRYAPPPPIKVPSPGEWGDPNIVRARLGTAVTHICFLRPTMFVPALSPQHYRATFEQTAGPVRKIVEVLSATDPAKLEAFRREYESLVSEYFDDNLVRQDYLMTRAVKS